jgi:hypothetical protein
MPSQHGLQRAFRPFEGLSDRGEGRWAGARYPERERGRRPEGRRPRSSAVKRCYSASFACAVSARSTAARFSMTSRRSAGGSGFASSHSWVAARSSSLARGEG